MAKEPEVLKQSADQKEAERMREAEGRPPITDNEDINAPSLADMEAAKAVRDRRENRPAGRDKRSKFLAEVRDPDKRTLQVRATAVGFYDGYKVPGQRFRVNPKLFTDTWMMKD